MIRHLTHLSLHLKGGFFFELLADGLLLSFLCLLELCFVEFELLLGFLELLLDARVKLNRHEGELSVGEDLACGLLILFIRGCRLTRQVNLCSRTLL